MTASTVERAGTNGSDAGTNVSDTAAADVAAAAVGGVESDCWPVPPIDEAPMDMFSHMFEEKIVDLRRRSLTQINVIVERSANGPLLAHPLALAVLAAAVYARYVLPAAMYFGSSEWQASVDAGDIVPRAGGYAADVHWATAFLLSFAYVGLVISGVRFMEKRMPVQLLIFEFMAIYNCMQVLLNLYQVLAIVAEVRKLGFKMWGYEPDASPAGYALGQLIWLQYHCRQLELMDTFFMVLRKKFQGISAVHMYLRVLNMWGWFFACRFACGGDTYFPALVNSAAQVVQYLYFSLNLFGFRHVPFFQKARVAEVQIAQFLLCLVHNLLVAGSGHMPRMLALMHLFVILNGLVLYTDFHSRSGDDRPLEDRPRQAGEAMPRERVTFSFDSAGWLYVYHFGVATWLQEHITPGISTDAIPTYDFPKGLGFSGSSAGALTALLLASGTSVRDVFEYVLAQHEVCSLNPRMMPVCVEEALRKFQYPGAYKILTWRLRILVTRVLLRPPFFMGEVVDQFQSNEACIHWLLASCHVPIVFGILPYIIGGKAYYDGMMWSSLLVPWRGSVSDRIIKISGFGSPFSDIRAPVVPPWWGILPPSPRVLRGFYYRGYQDAQAWFQASPKPFFDPCSTCGSRKVGSATDGGDAGKAAEGQSGSDESGFAKWKAATALLRKSPDTEPTTLDEQIDDVTGEKVGVLISDFQATAKRRFHAAVLVTFGSAALLALTYLPPRNAVLAAALVISTGFTWTMV